MKNYDSKDLDALSMAIGRDLTRQYIRFILLETPRTLLDARIALKEQDYARLLTAAQALGEVADGLGAEGFSQLFTDLVTAYTAKEAQLAEGLVSSAEAEWKGVANELQKWLSAPL
jgi:hypothetical protein